MLGIYIINIYNKMVTGEERTENESSGRTTERKGIIKT